MVFSCKMCGANLNVRHGMKICKCDYCDSVQTIPDLSSEKKINLFKKADGLWFSCDFDRASDVYRDIIADFPEEAEAYWGLCMCKYGIEYVVDPETQHRVPTCHRTSFEKIHDIPEFRKALEYADNNSRIIYSQLADVIDGIQQNILSIAMNEKPFDVFICYKETAESGGRSPDAFLAEKIYSALSGENIKVFFAPVTLKDKLGTEFEPYIYSAINSAQIMICVGTSFEHFDSVWVRNEWSRFIELMKKDKSKILIPCYSDMVISQLPEEFKGFQAQNMSEENALENIVKSVTEIMTASEGAKSQLNILMEQFEGQLRNERTKLRMLENIHHTNMVMEKHNAQKLFKKEYTSPMVVWLFGFFMIWIMVFLGIEGGASFSVIAVLSLLLVVFPMIFMSVYIKKKNKIAYENLNRRLAYNENAPDFDYGSQNEDVIRERTKVMNKYEKKKITVDKGVLFYIAWSVLRRVVSLFFWSILGGSVYSAYFFNGLSYLLAIVFIVLIILYNIKIKKKLKSELEEIDKKYNIK